DPYIDFVRTETLRALDPIVRKALADGRSLNMTSDAGMRYLLRNMSTDDLLKMKRTRGVDVELLYRPGIRDEQRREAVADLAKLDGKSELRILLDAIRKQESGAGNQTPVDESVLFDFTRLLTSRGPGELKPVRGELEALAT